MIHDRVVRSQARIGVIVRLFGQPELEIDCVIDTGFKGSLTLPPAAIQALGLPYLTELTANLADDTGIRVDVHVATIRWDGAEREVAVLALGRRPLIGTELLGEHHLAIDFTDGGMVSVDAL